MAQSYIDLTKIVLMNKETHLFNVFTDTPNYEGQQIKIWGKRYICTKTEALNKEHLGLAGYAVFGHELRSKY